MTRGSVDRARDAISEAPRSARRPGFVLRRATAGGIDGLVLIGLGVAHLFIESVVSIEADAAQFLVVAITMMLLPFLYRVISVITSQATFGMKCVDLWIETVRGEIPSPRCAFLRALSAVVLIVGLFVLAIRTAVVGASGASVSFYVLLVVTGWAAVVIVGCPAVRRDGRGVPDLVAGSRVVPAYRPRRPRSRTASS